MSRLSVPPPTRPPVTEDVPKPKAATSSANGKITDAPATSSKQAAAAVAAKARSPSPEPAKVGDDKTKAMPSLDAAVSAKEEESNLPVLDMETFDQILELDEDEDDREFSSGMVWQYFEQAEEAFTDMDEKLKAGSLSALSSLGHYLKGSSAALGVARVQATCEKIQHYGQCWDEEKKVALGEKEALDKIGVCLKRVRVEYRDAEKELRGWYKARGIVQGP